MTHGESALKSLSDSERLDWLQLARSENVGPVTFRKLLRHFGSAGKALAALPDMARRGGASRSPRICSKGDAERELERAATFGCRMIGLSEPVYPAALRAAESAPALLTVRGHIDVLSRPAVAIVGSRNASVVGCKIARNLAAGVAGAGYATVSGLARGIDAAAHEATVETGTIAVMAGGLDRPYPPQNIELLEAICENGQSAAISEMPFGWEPRARDFPRRNRIIAGVGLGLVVVEAARKSGSLISARIAGELGRLVFAVPGSPLDPRARGTNDLIRDGAILTAEPDDLLEALAPLTGKDARFNQPMPSLEEEAVPAIDAKPSEEIRTHIATALGPAPAAVDDLVRHTGLPPSEVYMVLLELDLAGRLTRHPGGSVSLLPPIGN
ncbi:MAG: DNA-processing protein DprA [Pseudomonadota bacterium]